MFVEREFAVEVVVDVANEGGVRGDDGLMGGEGEFGKWEGDAFVGGEKGGCVVDGESLVWDYVAFFFGSNRGNVREGDVFFVFGG